MDPLAASFSSISETLRAALSDAAVSVLSFAPPLIIALAVFAAGIALSGVFSALVEHGIAWLGLDGFSDRTGFSKALRFFGEKAALSRVAGLIVRIAVLIAFSKAALDIAGLPEAAAFLSSLIAFVPRVIIALLALLAGFAGGEGVVWIVRRSVGFFHIPVSSLSALVLLVRAMGVSLGGVAALRALGATERMVDVVFIATAFAIALSFGLAGKEHASAAIARASKGE